ncbi:hypothetical protein QTL95_01595 [Rhizobium sp. S152]|uniref:hypothetical protein n=1 Tax=Rhizobium sp. S152 TaxID=3055038 RepID=UPI0025AA2E48|nr:hypothetical protein [Rhizobium sp. S152]MDM9624570.1 hypothetical protein [Rhizobium sp. S152]
MSGLFDTYAKIVFIDTMVVLEGKPISQLPWHEIDPAGPILVMVVPQVQTEIDKRKRDGRLADRSRAFSRLIGPSVELQQTVRISDKRVVVDLMLASCARVDYDVLDLDREEGDHKVVGQIINAKGVDLKRSILISHDINPVSLAIQHGIAAKRLPEHWLLPPEPSPKERENLRLKAELSELKKSEPEITVEITVDLPDGFTPLRILDPDDRDKSNLTQAVEKRYFAKLQKRGTEQFMNQPRWVPPDRWREDKVPKYVSNLPRHLQSLFNQVSFTVAVNNVGPVTASNLVVEISVEGGRFDTSFHYGRLFPPSPPQANVLAAALGRQPAFPQMPRVPGDHEVHWGVPPRRGNHGELHCREFRQGRSWVGEGFAEISSDSGGTLSIVVRVTASNLHGDVRGCWTRELVLREAVLADVFDIDSLHLVSKYPLQKRVDESTSDSNRRWISLDD